MAEDVAALLFDAQAFNVPQVAPSGAIVPYRAPGMNLGAGSFGSGMLTPQRRPRAPDEPWMTSLPVQQAPVGRTMSLAQAVAPDEIMVQESTPEEDPDVVSAASSLANLDDNSSHASVSRKSLKKQKAAKRPKGAKSPKKAAQKAPRKQPTKEKEKPLKKRKLPPKPKEPAAKKPKKAPAGGLPTMHLQTYIHKVLKQVHRDMTIGNKAINIMNGIVAYSFGRIADEAASVMRLRKGHTLTARDIQGGVRLWMGERGTHGLRDHAVSEGVKATTKYGAEV